MEDVDYRPWVFVAMVIALAVAQFVIMYPSPVPTAKHYVRALESAYAGDLVPLRCISSYVSEDKVSGIGAAIQTAKQQFTAAGKPDPLIKLKIVSIDEEQINDKDAVIYLKIRMLVNGKPYTDQHLRVFLIKEGYRYPRWGVDLANSGIYAPIEN